MLTVTAQQSRFHAEAIEGSALKEIVVKDLSIHIGQREILSHANFQLQVGKHYVLIGRNGTGKSTLLQAIATERIPSIPASLRILLLGQTEAPDAVEASVEKLSLDSETVLSHVVRSDKVRETLVREERILAVALDDVNDPVAAVRASRRVANERLHRRVEEASRIAQRRSGARGAKARKELIKLEEELEASERGLEPGSVDATGLASETTQAADTLADVQTRLEAMGASESEGKARAILLGLGFSPESIDSPVSQLSGGWKTRCSLASALSQPCDVLLLDEPTNFLDLPSIIWLETYLQDIAATTTVVVVTHDRSFADKVAHELLVLRNAVLERFKGNLSMYERERVKTWKSRTRMKDAQDKQKKHMQATVEANVRAAKRAGDDKKLKQAVSRKKKLGERMGLEVSAKGTRFKLNRDYAGHHLTYRPEIEVPEFDPPVRLSIPTTPPDLRFPGALLTFEKVCFAYGNGIGKKQILKDVDLSLHLGDRVGVAGLNGSGKTTLVSLAMAAATNDGGCGGATAQLRPSSGIIKRHPRAKFGYFSQQAVEDVTTLATQQPQLTALRHMLDTTGQDEKDARALLSGVGLTGRTVSDVPVGLLSGGQKVRLALAKLLAPQPPHLLVLDEVTTHLDADTIEALVHALRRYEGALLVVTHDRFFMRCVVEGEAVASFARGARAELNGADDDPVDEGEDSSDSGAEGVRLARHGVVYRLSKARLTPLDGGMEGYEQIAARVSSKLAKV